MHYGTDDHCGCSLGGALLPPRLANALYPAARTRERETWPRLEAIFPRHESTRGYVICGTANATIIMFSGTPDRVEIWAELNDLIVTLTDLLEREEATVTIRAGQYWEPSIPCRQVIARNAVAGSIGQIQVVGKWAQRS